MNKTQKVYAWLSLGLLAFGAVYELFGHGVRSPYMHLAYLIPLLGGLLPALLSLRPAPGDWSRLLWRSGLACLTVGSLYRGVLDIYGTTSRLGAVYPAAGAALLGLSLALLARRACRQNP